VITEDEATRLLKRADPARVDDNAPFVDAAGYLAALRPRSTTVTLIDSEPAPSGPGGRHRPLIIAVAAAAVVVIVVGALVLAARNDTTEPQIPAGPVPSASTTPATPVPSTETRSLTGDLEPGTQTFGLVGPLDSIRVTMTLPEGWHGSDGLILSSPGAPTVLQDRARCNRLITYPHGSSTPCDVDISLWSAPDVVYGNPCHWYDTPIEVDPTVESIAQALSAQKRRGDSTPHEITVGDHRGVELELTVPDNIDFATCDQGQFRSWGYTNVRFHQAPGQRDLIRLLDVDGLLVIIDADSWPGVPDGVRADLDRVLDSMTFERTSPESTDSAPG
jgi:hypothetical protein